MDQDDIIVAGTGPAGLIAAIALAGSGWRVRLVGPDPRLDDRRTTALMTPALDWLAGLGVGEALKAQGAPLRTMRIVDMTRRLVRSRPVAFRSAEIGEEAFGWNIPNAAMLKVLSAAVEAHPGIARSRGLVAQWRPAKASIEAGMADGCTLSARLAVAADGRGSPAREAAGIRLICRDLGQTALVLDFSHARDHGSSSTEFHTEAGPFTVVPLPGRRSSLVWVVRPGRAEELAGTGDDALALLVEEQMQSMLGRIRIESGRQVWPLATAMPTAFARNRVALVGEAAHLFPPIGAQGLNLGVRDIRDLAAVAADHRDDPGSPAALAAYSRRRRPDILARTGAVSALNASLLSDFLPAQLARSAGLGLLGAFAPLRALFMREGLEPGSGFAAAFSSLRKEVRR